MKPTDLSVYDFNEEDEMVENCSNPWSKFSNPKSHNVDARIKYDFLQHASSGSITQMKESHNLKQIHVVPIDDDDDCGLVNDDSGSLRNASIEVAVKQAEVFGAVSDRLLQQSCHFDGESVSHGSSLLEVQLKLSNSHGHSPGNDHMTHISPTFPESPYINGSVDAGPSDGSDSIQDNSPSTSGSMQEETAFPFEELSQNVLYSGLDMEKMDTTLPADYVYFGKKYIPACLIVFSETSLKIEMESEASKVEWDIEDIVSIASHWFMRASTAKVKVHILTKDAVPEENQQECITGVAELEFLVHDPHWLQRQESIISLGQRYRAIWRTGMNGELYEEGSLDSESSQPYIPRFKEPFDELVYPKGDTDAVSISRTDVELLKPDTFLNDTIIDFYLKYLRNGIPPLDRGRFHFFNSFFFTKLADPNKNASGDFDGKAGFQRVRKWTRKVNLFEKDYIFIPVNYNLHWSLIVICHPGEVAEFNEENLDHSVKVPCVLHMDSIRGSHTGLKDLVQRYLLEEWKEKHKEISEETVSKFLNLRFLSLELPQQENFSDCGLFLLHYAELFIIEAPENFSPFQINKLDNFLKPDWFIPAEASRKRVHIQRLIYDLLEDCPLENTSSSSHESQPPILLKAHDNDNSREAPSGMDIGLLDISMCSNVSCLGMRDLECQNYGHGASSGQPLCPAPPIREEEGVDHPTSSAFGQSELQSIDEVASVGCHLDYTPRVNHRFQWKLEYSDQGFHPDNNSPLFSNHSSEDSEDVMIMEHEPEVECPNPGENRTSDPHKENIDSLTESYVSASSDVMQTPPEDSQELSNSHENPSTPNLESSKEMPASQEIENDEVTASVNEVVEDSCSDSDEGHAAKRIRLMPSSDEERRRINSLSEEVQV